MGTITVVSGIQKRRRFTTSQKIAMVEEAMQPGMSVSSVARKYDVSPSQLFNWRRRMTEGGKEAIKADDDVVAAAEVRELKNQFRELQRVLDKKTLENEILRDTVQLAHEKKLISRLPSLPEEDIP
jgi:transposase